MIPSKYAPGMPLAPPPPPLTERLPTITFAQSRKMTRYRKCVRVCTERSLLYTTSLRPLATRPRNLCFALIAGFLTKR